MTVVKNCSTLEDAYLARNLLETEGIAADILDEATANNAPYLLTSGIRLAVADEDAATARQLLGLPPLAPTPRRSRRNGPAWLIVGMIVLAIFSLFATRNRSAGTKKPETRLEEDRNQDGKTDYRVDYVNHLRVKSFRDDDFDGRWDTITTFENGEVSRTEHDLDFDGTFDTASTWKLDILQSETVTPGGKGHPLFRFDFKKGVLDARWEDNDRDGTWDTVISYDPMGRETDRKALR